MPKTLSPKPCLTERTRFAQRVAERSFGSARRSTRQQALEELGRLGTFWVWTFMTRSLFSRDSSFQWNKWWERDQGQGFLSPA